MRIKLSSLVRVLFYIVVLLNLGYGKLFAGSILSTSYIPISTLLLIGICFICNYSRLNACRRKLHNPHINRALLIIFSFEALEIAYTYIRYGTSIDSIWQQCAYWGLLLAVYPLIYLFAYDGGIEKVLRHCILMASIMILLKSLNWYAYNFAGMTINYDIMFEYGTGWTRGGINRILDTCLGGIVILWLVYEYKESNYAGKRAIYLLLAIIYVSIVYLISNARAALICQSISLAVMLLYSQKLTRKNIVAYIATLIAVGFFLGSDMTQNIISSFFDKNSSFFSSTTTRQLSLAHYYSYFKESPLFGIGFISESDGFTRLLHGPGNFAFSDLGVLGMILHYGLFGLISFFVVYLRLLKIAMNLYKTGEYASLAIGMVVYFTLASFISMNMFDYQRIFAVPFFMAIMEHLFSEYRDNKKEALYGY